LQEPIDLDISGSKRTLIRIVRRKRMRKISCRNNDTAYWEEFQKNRMLIGRTADSRYRLIMGGVSGTSRSWEELQTQGQRDH
jgi:hypothetical protein